MWPWQKKRPDGPSYIGPGVRFVGRIESAGELTIDGQFEGDIVHEGRLVIGAGAVVVSDIRATSAQVAGVVRGNVQVEETLELLATARLQGDIACVSLQIAQGAVFTGRNQMAGAPEAPAATAAPTPKAEPAPLPVAAAVQKAEPVAAPLAVLLEPVGIAEREVLGVAPAPARVAPVPTPLTPAPVARVEAPAFYGGFKPTVRSEAS